MKETLSIADDGTYKFDRGSIRKDAEGHFHAERQEASKPSIPGISTGEGCPRRAVFGTLTDAISYLCLPAGVLRGAIEQLEGE